MNMTFCNGQTSVIEIGCKQIVEIKTRWEFIVCYFEYYVLRQPINIGEGWLYNVVGKKLK